jgi:hypothetical protein
MAKNSLEEMAEAMLRGLEADSGRPLAEWLEIALRSGYTVRLSELEAVDEELIGWLRLAYEGAG